MIGNGVSRLVKFIMYNFGNGLSLYGLAQNKQGAEPNRGLTQKAGVFHRG